MPITPEEVENLLKRYNNSIEEYLYVFTVCIDSLGESCERRNELPNVMTLAIAKNVVEKMSARFGDSCGEARRILPAFSLLEANLAKYPGAGLLLEDVEKEKKEFILKCWSYDLHVHTCYSKETKITPAEIVCMAKDTGLEGIAVTDHDTVRGIKESIEAASKAGIEIIPGIEIDFNSSVGSGSDRISFGGELLGYFIDFNFPGFERLEADSTNSRKENITRIIKRLKQAGYKIDEQELKGGLKKDCIVKRDLCDHLVETEQAADLMGAYGLIGEKGAMHLDRDKISLESASEMIQASKGVPILAHPGIILKQNNLSFEFFKDSLAKKMIESGIMGFEIYPYWLSSKGYSRYESDRINEFFSQMNRISGLIDKVSGSDFHDLKRDARIGCFPTRKKTVEELRSESKRNS